MRWVQIPILTCVSEQENQSRQQLSNFHEEEIKPGSTAGDIAHLVPKVVSGDDGILSFMKQIFSVNGEIQPLSKAQIPAEKIESMYGFGVYETIKVRNGILYFVDTHVDRLFHSASCIDLPHLFTEEQVTLYIHQLLHKLSEDSLNLKVLLMGSDHPHGAMLYIFALAPFFPKRAWYRDGVSVCSYVYERWMPQAKSLNMLPSYYYYTKAKSEGHYDALFVDNNHNIREGTRTNFYVMKGSKIYSAPKSNVLVGVTMMTLEKAIKNTAFSIQHKQIPYASLSSYDAAFLSSTSTKIIPISSVDGKAMPISQSLYELVDIYNKALDRSEGMLSRI